MEVKMAVICSKHFSNSIIFSVARSLSSFSSNINIADSNKIKAFKQIPGPVRLPVIGNLYQYKFGMLSSFIQICFLSNIKGTSAGIKRNGKK
jgi:hypothetical protein